MSTETWGEGNGKIVLMHFYVIYFIFVEQLQSKVSSA